MAQYDVYRAPEGDLWVDCQADSLDALNSRFVIPAVAVADAVVVDRRLTPTVMLNGEAVVLLTHLSGAVAARALRQREGSLAADRYVIQAAIDMLVQGF